MKEEMNDNEVLDFINEIIDMHSKNIDLFYTEEMMISDITRKEEQIMCLKEDIKTIKEKLHKTRQINNMSCKAKELLKNMVK